RRSTSAAYPVPKFEVRKPVRVGSTAQVTIGEYSDMPSREDVEQHWVPQFGGGEYTIYAKSAAYTGPVIGFKFPGTPKWTTPDDAIREARKAKESEKPKTLEERMDDMAIGVLEQHPEIGQELATDRLYAKLGLKRKGKKGDDDEHEKPPVDPFDELEKWVIRAERFGLVNRSAGDGEKKTSIIDLVMELARTGQLEPLVGRITSMIPQAQQGQAQPQVSGAPQQPALGPGQPQPQPTPQPRPQPSGVQQGPQPAQQVAQPIQPVVQEAPVDTAQLLNKLKTRLKGTDLMGVLKAADWEWLKNSLTLRPTEFVQKLYADLQAKKPGLSELEVILHEFTVDEIRALLAEVKKLLDNPFIKALASATMDSKSIDTVSAVATVLVTPAGAIWLASVKQGIDLTYRAVEESMNRAGVGEAATNSGSDDAVSEVDEDGPDAGSGGAVVVVQAPDRPKNPAPVAAIVDIPASVADDDGDENASNNGPAV
ncbi:MAG: hypothetical protein Q8O76_04945, partial [Chloroflexota bacterium]|nr:hypothetical protein [Chloroflexota bacterium]